MNFWRQVHKLAQPLCTAQIHRVTRLCEVCRPGQAGSSLSVRFVRFGRRVVALCANHHAELQRAGATTLEQARAVFREVGGHRSRLPRRDARDRRVFPQRVGGERRRHDRRTGQ